MITSLNIKNVGIINKISLDLSKGLGVLTGETGAGKTLIIDSLSIISGGRFSKEMIRTGESYSYVEASLFLPNNKYNGEADIIVSREINLNGKNICKINGRMVTVNELKEFMKDVIDIHGQHDNHILMESSKHIEYLDKYSGKALLTLKNQYEDLFKKYKEIIEKLDKNFGNDIEKRRMLDLLEYQLNEILEANLEIGEEKDIESKLRLSKNAEKIAGFLNIASNQLNQNTITGIESVMKSLGKIESYNENYKIELSRVTDAYYNLLESAANISSYSQDIEFNTEELTFLQNRLDLIYSLKRKYGNSIEEINTYKEKVEIQIDTINNMEMYIQTLKLEKAEIEEKMKIIALEIHNIREEKAVKLANKINKELSELEMKNAKFKVDIVLAEKFNVNGMDKVEFLISTNVGDVFKPLSKIASGGEISRIMLAIKTVLSTISAIPVMILDEIDTGISGTAAKSVSEKIRKISNVSQVLCVSHLAVIAAKADTNYYISKSVENGSTKTNIRILKELEVLNEIARISTGEINEISLNHAKSLRGNRLATV